MCSPDVHLLFAFRTSDSDYLDSDLILNQILILNLIYKYLILILILILNLILVYLILILILIYQILNQNQTRARAYTRFVQSLFGLRSLKRQDQQ